MLPCSTSRLMMTGSCSSLRTWSGLGRWGAGIACHDRNALLTPLQQALMCMLHGPGMSTPGVLAYATGQSISGRHRRQTGLQGGTGTIAWQAPRCLNSTQLSGMRAKHAQGQVLVVGTTSTEATVACEVRVKSKSVVMSSQGGPVKSSGSTLSPQHEKCQGYSNQGLAQQAAGTSGRANECPKEL